MMKRRAMLTLLTLFLLKGCAPMGQWTKRDFNLETFKRDDYDCSRDVRMVYGNSGVASLPSMYSMYRQCMTAKGYEEVSSCAAGECARAQ